MCSVKKRDNGGLCHLHKIKTGRNGTFVQLNACSQFQFKGICVCTVDVFTKLNAVKIFGAFSRTQRTIPTPIVLGGVDKMFPFRDIPGPKHGGRKTVNQENLLLLVLIAC